MLEAIFGSKKEMFDMEVYWSKETLLKDMVADLDRIGEYIVKPDAFKSGSRIVTVKEWYVDDTAYMMAELYVDKRTMKQIENDSKENRFKAVKFVKTTVG